MAKEATILLAAGLISVSATRLAGAQHTHDERTATSDRRDATIVLHVVNFAALSHGIQIYVRPFRGPAARGRCHRRKAGASREWRPDGRELCYVAPDARLMAVPIAVGTDSQTLEAGATVPLFRTQLASGAGGTFPV